MAKQISDKQISDKLRSLAKEFGSLADKIGGGRPGAPVLPDESGKKLRRDMVRAKCDYIASHHGGSHEYLAAKCGLPDARAIEEEWLSEREDRSLPSDEHMKIVDAMFKEEWDRHEKTPLD